MFPSLVSFPAFLIHPSQVKFSLALWPNPKSYWTSDPHHWPKVDEATPSKTTTDKSASCCTFEFSRITRWQSWHFCTNCNENKLEVDTSGINFNANLHLS